MTPTTIFRSNSALDVLQAGCNKYWDHTRAAKKLREGDTIVIHASRGACKELGLPFHNQQVLRAVATTRVCRVQHENWASNLVQNSQKHYVHRVEFSNVEFIPVGMLDDEVIARINAGTTDKGRIAQHGIGYVGYTKDD
jgi:hypothetical protein